MVVPWGANMNMKQKICKYEAIRFMIAEMWKSTLRNTYKAAKSKPTSNKLKEEICFILKTCYSLEHKKVYK